MVTQNSENELTEKELEEINQLKPGFNIVPESKDINILTSNRIEISRKWAKKLLVLSFFFNIVTIACFALSAIFVALKPPPSFYGSTPSGKVYGPLKRVIIK